MPNTQKEFPTYLEWTDIHQAECGSETKFILVHVSRIGMFVTCSECKKLGYFLRDEDF